MGREIRRVGILHIAYVVIQHSARAQLADHAKSRSHTSSSTLNAQHVFFFLHAFFEAWHNEQRSNANESIKTDSLFVYTVMQMECCLLRLAGNSRIVIYGLDGVHEPLSCTSRFICLKFPYYNVANQQRVIPLTCCMFLNSCHRLSLLLNRLIITQGSNKIKQINKKKLPDCRD